MPRELGKVHTTENYYRIPLTRKACSIHRYKTLSEEKGIKALFCCPKDALEKGRCQEPMFTKTLLYDREKWTKRQAEFHVKNWMK